MLCVTVAIHVGLTRMEYFSIEDSGVMSVVLESDQPANTSITVTLNLATNTASGITSSLCDVFNLFVCLSEMDFNSDDIDVVFSPSDTEVITNITITADRFPETNETFIITVIIPSDTNEIGVNSGTVTNATGVILNDDSKI